MNVSELLSQDAAPLEVSVQSGQSASAAGTNLPHGGHNLRQMPLAHVDNAASVSTRPQSESPDCTPALRFQKSSPKVVNFQLLLSDIGEQRARLPLRVNVRDHDNTDSIISTVKNFYGLYQEQGISFEDATGTAFIARYENFEDNTTVFVKVTGVQLPPANETRQSVSPTKPQLQEPFEMLPPLQPRPQSRSSRKRSLSPASDLARRSGVNRPPLNPKNLSVWTDMHGEREGLQSHSDNDSMSVSSSRRGRENLASAEISTDNIVEGGRRKRAKFESSELPLFQPPTFPMNPSMSSASPQRRNNNVHAASPLPYGSAQNIMNNYPMLSPQSLGHSDNSMSLNSAVSGRHTGARAANGHRPSRLSGGSMSGILPTPAPTVGSMISDEDVAYQLMRLGDAPSLSYGRMSASTADDALSGKADAASSDEFSDVESEARDATLHRKKHVAAGSASTRGTPDHDHDYRRKLTSNANRPKKSSSASNKARKTSATDIPPSPYSLPAGRKHSVSSEHFHSVGGGDDDDDDDLSSKPRCQRCRKSKKGCDRQRPCGRCKDAGIGIDGCVSEDEGNGRKGRFGRHMGVPLKKPAGEVDAPSPVAFTTQAVLPSLTTLSDAAAVAAAKDKKRKR